jgi:hypothetical protein
MALTARNAGSAPGYALVAAHNALCKALVGTNPHVDITSTPGGDFSNPTSTPLAASGTTNTLDACIATLASLAVVLHAHYADTLAHKAADGTNALATPVPTDWTTVIARVNEVKAVHNAHCAQAGVHHTNDATNTIATVDAAVDAQADPDGSISAKVLVAACVTKVNAHILAALGSVAVNLTAP